MTRAKLLILLLSICIIFSLFGNSHAGSLKEEYELQERCGKIAAEKFRENYGKTGKWSDENTQYIIRQRNHYNKKLNKCFCLLTTYSIPKRESGRPSSEIEFWDINEEKQYGDFYKFSTSSKPAFCDVSGKHCNSEAEWNSLVKPYMEE